MCLISGQKIWSSVQGHRHPSKVWHQQGMTYFTLILNELVDEWQGYLKVIFHNCQMLVQASREVMSSCS